MGLRRHFPGSRGGGRVPLAAFQYVGDHVPAWSTFGTCSRTAAPSTTRGTWVARLRRRLCTNVRWRDQSPSLLQHPARRPEAAETHSSSRLSRRGFFGSSARHRYRYTRPHGQRAQARRPNGRRKLNSWAALWLRSAFAAFLVAEQLLVCEPVAKCNRTHNTEEERASLLQYGIALCRARASERSVCGRVVLRCAARARRSVGRGSSGLPLAGPCVAAAFLSPTHAQ